MSAADEPAAPVAEGRWPVWGTAALAVAVACWRLFSVSPAGLWRDWALILAGYGIYTVFARRRPSWPAVTAGVMAFLLGIYVQGQWPHLVALFREAP